MTMTLACDTYFRQCEMIAVRAVAAASPDDSHARSTSPMKSVEHVAYEVAVDHRGSAAAESFAIVNVVKH